MRIKLNKRAIEVDAKKVSAVGKYLGLMFKLSNTRNLLFHFDSSRNPTIHSYLVFFPFLAIWLDKSNKVVDFGVVKPFTFSVSPKKPATKLLEIPLNKKNKRFLAFFVDE